MTLEIYGAEQRALGKYLNTIDQIRSWREKPLLPKEEAIDLFCVTEEQFDQVVRLLGEGKSDEEIYEEVDWRNTSRPHIPSTLQ